MESKVSGDLLRADGHDDGMTGVVPACATGADIGVGSEDVNELSLPLVAPLRSEYDAY